MQQRPSRPGDAGGTRLPPVTDLLSFLDRSPSPYHAVASAVGRLEAAGFRALDEGAAWDDPPNLAYLVRGGSLVAWAAAPGALAEDGFRIVGAHTDSPNLRVKPRPDTGRVGYRQVGVEVYGGALYNSWLDRDLGLSGRVAVRSAEAAEAPAGTAARGTPEWRSRYADAAAEAPAGAAAPASPGWRSRSTEGGAEQNGAITTPLVHVDRPLLRVPQLAIHLDRGVNDGLKLNPQQHLVPLWGLGDAREGDLAGFLAAELGVAPADVLAWDVMLHDVTPAALLGRDRELVSSARLDNLLSCWAATEALVAVSARDGVPGETRAPVAPEPGPVAVICLFDHEEIGSQSATGAAGAILPTVLERIALAHGLDREGFLRALARSWCVSADGAHATHPNYPERHEPGHHIALDGGPVLKVNANVRYATDAPGSARFRVAAERAGVPVQEFVVRTDLPCGSTIGPITAAKLGIPTTDVGVAQLAMHSVRELCGADDPAHFVAALTECLAD
jgi:aspartyl aminopeptidase